MYVPDLIVLYIFTYTDICAYILFFYVFLLNVFIIDFHESLELLRFWLFLVRSSNVIGTRNVPLTAVVHDLCSHYDD